MAMVVNDVTLAAQTVSQTVNKKERETKSSITPFQKILDKEEKNLAYQADKSSAAAQTARLTLSVCTASVKIFPFRYVRYRIYVSASCSALGKVFSDRTEPLNTLE